MTQKLTYFNMPGLAEGIRYILHYTGQNFQDEWIPLSSWPDKQLKESLPFGQLPLYEDGERSLHQSLAIARYIATNTLLLPSDPWDQAVLDAAALTVYDFQKLAASTFFEKDPVRREKLIKTFLDESVDYTFSRLEKQIKGNNGFLHKKLSWADFLLVGIVETANIFYKSNLAKNYPAISELISTVHNQPGVKEYVMNRKPFAL